MGHDKDVNEEEAKSGASTEVRPKNWPKPAQLLCLREWYSYGYELMQRASAFGLGGMNPGTTYRTLLQMEEVTVEPGWESPTDGPARRVYRVTETGARIPGPLGRVSRAIPADAFFERLARTALDNESTTGSIQRSDVNEEKEPPA